MSIDDTVTQSIIIESTLYANTKVHLAYRVFPRA